ncbi:hypothetical protein FNV82_06335 [Chlorobium phaeovibrioides]|nr:hypothetical protein FNV82_06335 [Chlorobium phaeovibrioides]
MNSRGPLRSLSSPGSLSSEDCMRNSDLYHLEEYLFSEVGPKFLESGRLSAFDFFCIVIWKANRAKSKIAKRLLEHDGRRGRDLDAIVGELAAALWREAEKKERLRILIKDWAFRLPMASAILTALWPEEFTVYDVRVCDALDGHHLLQNKSNIDVLWAGYQEFISDVERHSPAGLSLRDKDRCLWGQSFREQLHADIDAWRLSAG